MIRKALKSKTQGSRSRLAKTVSRQAPTLGWNARDSLANMKVGYATRLLNWFPTTVDCEIRGGSEAHATGIPGVVKTLAVYNAMNGTNKLFASTPTAVWDTSSAGVVVPNYVNLPGASGDYASTPDSVAASITGDIDIRVRAALTDWTPAAISVLVAKSVAAADQRSYSFAVKTDGTLQIQTSPDGTAGALVTSASTVPPTVANGAALWVRVTLDVNNGAGGNDAKFYVSADYDLAAGTGTWTQLGATVTTVGTTSIFNSTAPVEIGSRDVGTTQVLAGKVFAAQIYSGIGGMKAVEFNAQDTYAGDTSFPGFALAEVWTINGAAAIVGTATSSRTDGKHQYVNFGDGTNNWLIMVNGVDRPLYFNGTAWTAVDSTTSPALTGLTSTSIIGVNSFKGRLFFIEKNSLSFWYLPAGAAGGALTEFDLSSIVTRGGFLMWMATWTRDGGSGPDDFAVFMTSEGEVVVYQGTNPSSAVSWSKVGTYFLGKPLGRRSFVQYGGDLVAITENGAFPLSVSLGSSGQDNRLALTNTIENAFNDAARTIGGNFGWEGVVFPSRSAMLFNIPFVEGARHEQYVMNTITKAWCRFDSWDAECFAVFNKELYFGKTAIVQKAWTGRADDGANIVADGKTAFDYFGSGTQNKKWNMYRAVMRSNGSFSYLTDLDADFNDDAILGVASYAQIASGVWDQSLWDTAVWQEGLTTALEWTSPAENLGFCAAAKIKVATKSLEVHWLSNDYVFEEGGTL